MQGSRWNTDGVALKPRRACHGQAGEVSGEGGRWGALQQHYSAVVCSKKSKHAKQVALAAAPSTQVAAAPIQQWQQHPFSTHSAAHQRAEVLRQQQQRHTQRR